MTGIAPAANPLRPVVNIEMIAAKKTHQRVELPRNFHRETRWRPTAATIGIPAISAFCSSSKLARPESIRMHSRSGNASASSARPTNVEIFLAGLERISEPSLHLWLDEMAAHSVIRAAW